MTDSDQRIVRDRQAAISDAIDRLDLSAAAPGLTILAQTVAVATYPTTAQAYYGMHAVDTVSGTESEGSTGGVSYSTPTFFALNLGTSIPLSGTVVLVTMVPAGRWVFRWDS